MPGWAFSACTGLAAWAHTTFRLHSNPIATTAVALVQNKAAADF